MKKTTIVFDMDGTLLNTLEDIADGVNHTLDQYALPGKSLEEIRLAVGNGARRLIQSVVPGGEEHPQFGQILGDYETYYRLHCDIKTEPYEGICEALDQLKKKHIKMAIVSNKGDGAVKELNRQYFGAYEMTAQGVRSGVRRKPAPDAVMEALRLLESTPEEAVYVGDSEVDYQTASNAGMTCVLVSWGFRKRAQLEKLRPDHLIDFPEELLRLVEP